MAIGGFIILVVANFDIISESAFSTEMYYGPAPQGADGGAMRRRVVDSKMGSVDLQYRVKPFIGER